MTLIIIELILQSMTFYHHGMYIPANQVIGPDCTDLITCYQHHQGNV